MKSANVNCCQGKLEVDIKSFKDYHIKTTVKFDFLIYADSVECLKIFEIKSYGGSCQAKAFMIMLATEIFITVQYRVPWNVSNKLDKFKTDHIRLGHVPRL